jgi:hypothetical protein
MTTLQADAEDNAAGQATKLRNVYAISQKRAASRDGACNAGRAGDLAARAKESIE